MPEVLTSSELSLLPGQRYQRANLSGYVELLQGHGECATRRMVQIVSVLAFSQTKGREFTLGDWLSTCASNDPRLRRPRR